MIKNTKIGTKVWFNSYQSINSGTIKSNVLTFKKLDVPEVKYVEISWDDGGSSSILLENLYETKEALINANKEKSDKIKEKYMSQINSIEDLVIFCFRHDMTSEYANYEALAVAKDKAKEYGINSQDW